MKIGQTNTHFSRVEKAILFLMRAFIGLFCMVTFGFTSNHGFPQTTVDIDADATMTVFEVFDLIQDQTEYYFIYKKEPLKGLSPIAVKKGRIKVSELLGNTLSLSKYTYKVKPDKTIIISRKKHAETGATSTEIQQLRVSGTVTAAPDNTPLPGVNIIVKGTSRGTMSDADGNYNITVRATDILSFSFVGYRTVEIPVDGRTTVNTQLEEAVTTLEGVEVNAGYYIVKDRERTGNISRVTSEEIELQPIVSPLEALQGRMAGVEIIQQSGVPGTQTRFRIRGQNSLRTSGNLPLYIIDGIPVDSNVLSSSGGLTSVGIDPLNTLNLSNIESIEVLKDADATAIYGSRGANGVVLITTKKSSDFPQKTGVEFQIYGGISTVSNKLDLLNTEQYLALRKEAFENDGVTPTEFNAVDLVVWDQDRYTNWQKKLFGGTAQVTDLNMAISGGNETTSYRLSGAYHSQGNVFPGDFTYQKVTMGLNLNHRSKNQKYHMNLSVNYGVDDNELFHGQGFVGDAIILPPNAPELYNEDGLLNWENSTWTNPLAVTNQDTRAETNNLVSNLVMSYRLVPNLILKANMGYSHLNMNEKVKRSIDAYDPADWDRRTSSSLHGDTKRKSWIIEPQLIYSSKTGIGNIEALLGTTFQHSENNTLRITGTGYSDKRLIGNLAAAEEVRINSNTNAQYRYHAIFGRIGYNWHKKYFINLTGRRDGSSRFGQDRRFANFGAIGGAWIFSEEDFVKKSMPFLSFGKLRGSYGITGSDQVGDYAYLDTYQPTPGPGGLYPTELSNPYYSWEENKKLEAAMDLSFFRNRVNLGVSWYRNRSSNQLVGYPLAGTTGFSLVQANLPATVQNMGWEIELSTMNIQLNDFQWQTALNLSIPKNKLISYPDLESSSYANTYRVGHPLNISLRYIYDGIDPDTGFYRVVDVNEDGRLDNNDRTVISFNGRNLFGGINNEFRYKNLSFSFLMEFVKHKEAPYNYTVPPGRYGNITIENYNVWKQPGDETNIQRASQSIQALLSDINFRNSDQFLSDASFIRLKTLSISYNLPKKVLGSFSAQSCRIYAHAQNLFTITGYKGLDPQFPGGSTRLPVLKSMTLGIQLKF
ncbi:SusC/RagA family TonB-linked outer membrane protein [Sinomicrobium kalidii]|uniref:SusC/RagA family TonB-linked outer membrane protein n=1 Tax=Sinomicrobium kalidii TaxID=2900738 RepID=UPI001E55CB56|nr:SusC/RagA family TonB-linked outer membrane protein [Sinomicrobium kalidii]UGU15735.1 SusC/RagA family TonB-linked outer membrane protein [Sinomicrobium kalidii]